MLVRLLRRIRPAIVHTYLSDANSYGRIAAIITRVPIIIASERNLPGIGNDKGRIQFFIDKLLAYFSQVIICNSLIASAALISDHSIDFRKVYTVHNGIDISPGKNSREKKWLGNQPVIGTIGRLYEQKNHKLFLETAKVLLQDPKLKTKLKFLIIGEGKLRQDLEVYADRCGIKSNVVFMGERGDIDNLLKEIDIFLMTSSFEGCSNAIMEAMLAGLPVVATDAGGNGELIIDGETGFICPKNDPGALASRIRMLLENRQIAKRIGNAANKRIIKNFGLEKMKNETQEIYLSTLSQKGLFNCFNENAKVGDIA